jgi:hypothetical protein
MTLKNTRANGKTAHTSSSKVGSGDFYGSGIRNKMARTIENMVEMPMPKGKMKRPPKTLA